MSGYVFFLIQEKSNDLLDKENISLLTSTSQGKINATAILISSGTIDDDDDDDDGDDDDDDDDKEEENRNDLLSQQSMKMLSKLQENTSPILKSIENIDGRDNDDYNDNDDGKLLPMPSRLYGNSNASPILISTENINDDDNNDNGDEVDSFTTQKLFSFAWQIAKGMVGIKIANSK